MKRFILVLFGLLTFGYIYAQSLKNDLSLDKYSNQTDIQAFRSITLTNGFHIPVQTGKTVTISISGIPAVLSQPSPGQNYILTRTFRDSIKVGALGNTRSIGQENQTIQYFDGLGRPSQTVELMASPTYKDIVQHVEYDVFGRESTKYLPYADKSGNGSFRADAKAIQGSFYAVGGGWDAAVAKTNQPYAVTVFENSPLNRVLQQGAPGAAWQPPVDRNVVASTTSSGRTVVSEYGTNGSDDVKLWTVNAAGNGANATYYVSGKLYKTVVKNENWVKADGKAGTVEEFTDFDGRVILKRVWNINSQTKVVYPLETQYVYDDFGDLRYVIPPAVTDIKFTEEATDPNFDKYIYAYKYDGLRRVIEKKIPGKGWDHFVYNKNDQLLQEQDAELRKTNKWVVTKYDAIGRVVITGIHQGSHPRDDEQKYINKEAVLWESRDAGQPNYSNLSYPRDNFTVHTITYYDDYSFQNAGLLPAKNITPSTKTNSLVTGVLIYRDNGTLPLLSINYYDDYGNVIQTASQNHLGGTDYVTNTYSFARELLTSSRLHTPKTGTSATIVTTNAYDHVGRLVSTKEKIGAQAEVELASNRYNEIGQLKIRYMGKTQAEPGYVDTTSYTYHERGWAKRIASTNFTMSLMYQDGGTVRQYNGNIAQQIWRFTPSSTTSTFEYSYDKLGRLTSGTNGQNGTASISEVMSYDEMGNIKTLKRDALDVTNYIYNGNKLTGVDGGIKGDYTYYDNGNAKTDRIGMAFTYNYLNLPQTAKKTGVDVAYLYDAAGTKLKKVSKIGTSPSIITTTRDYVGGIEYNNGVIDIIHNSVGYALKSGTNYVYHYNLTDHLGNVRTTLKRGSSATAVDIVQRDNYYPFGKRKVVAGGNNKYLYNGKEIQGELGDQYDYGARFYDAEIGRWNVIDQMAEKYRAFSPYIYTANNPILFVDPDGNDFIIHYGKDKTFVFNGKNQRDAPEDRFVQNVLMMFSYNEKNGGAINTTSIATNSKYQIQVKESQSDNGAYEGATNTINWNPNIAMITENNTVLSPASIFEHEAAHGKSFNDDPTAHQARQRTLVPGYKNLEEYRVVTGPEQTVARANGELKGGRVTRRYYDDSSRGFYETINPTSTVPRFNINRMINTMQQRYLGNEFNSPFKFSKDYWLNYYKKK